MWDISSEYAERLAAALFGLFIALIVTFIAWRRGYFRLPSLLHEELAYSLFSKMLAVFAIFFSIQMVLFPGLALLYFSYRAGVLITAPDALTVSDETLGWMQLISLIVSASAVLIFTRQLLPRYRHLVWGSGSYHGIKTSIWNFSVGAFSWIISYPWILAIGQIAALITLYFDLGPHPDQVAVHHLKETQKNPLLFVATCAVVVFVVPIVEEVLFRGFLQGWLRKAVGRKKGIVITAVVFAAFHYSGKQGAANIELVLSLFILANFLGFVSEKQQSLLASIGLHATFNAISILMITFS